MASLVYPTSAKGIDPAPQFGYTAFVKADRLLQRLQQEVTPSELVGYHVTHAHVTHAQVTRLFMLIQPKRLQKSGN